MDKIINSKYIGSDNRTYSNGTNRNIQSTNVSLNNNSNNMTNSNKVPNHSSNLHSNNNSQPDLEKIIKPKKVKNKTKESLKYTYYVSLGGARDDTEGKKYQCGGTACVEKAQRHPQTQDINKNSGTTENAKNNNHHGNNMIIPTNIAELYGVHFNVDTHITIDSNDKTSNDNNNSVNSNNRHSNNDLSSKIGCKKIPDGNTVPDSTLNYTYGSQQNNNNQNSNTNPSSTSNNSNSP